MKTFMNLALMGLLVTSVALTGCSSTVAPADDTTATVDATAPAEDTMMDDATSAEDPAADSMMETAQ